MRMIKLLARGFSGILDWGSENWHWQGKAGADEAHWLPKEPLIKTVAELERKEEHLQRAFGNACQNW